MTAIVTVLVLGFFVYLSYHYAPKRAEEIFRLDRFRAPGPLTDWSPSYYEDQRRYSDLAAIYGRSDMPDPDLGSTARPAVAAQRAESGPITKGSPVQLRKTGLVCRNLSAAGGTLTV
ncbi:hypothetical protein [Nocardia sp. NBC_01009]|uniref:hypothetical protein n=1 Tax=Nocardia sp. NBC_01009 TaxID=2975996 RepID=UPI0038631179|nr:hypothetical protein OHA42_02500 [Nocardia sp. NBC_01009]